MVIRKSEKINRKIAVFINRFWASLVGSYFMLISQGSLKNTIIMRGAVL